MLEGSFTPNLDRPGWGVAVDLEPDSPRLILAFSGRGFKVLGIPGFEFLRSLSLVQVKRAFIRDTRRLWYHRGVRGAGHDIDSVAEYLRGIVEEAGVSELAAVGSSAGGFGALAFGALLSCEVHAFSPQVFIDPELRRIHNDVRWQASIEELGEHMDPRYADLRPVIEASESNCHVYYPTGQPQDVAHAEHIGDLPQVTLYPFDSTSHNLVGQFREEGWLDEFIERLAAPAGS